MESIPSPQSFIFSDDYICQWDSCLKNFDDAEMLYEHLRDDHVGRKAHHNLCLTCKWDKCNVPTFAKRDHITSHLRVHVASKPYQCEVCKKGFKRPQDLKKHEKTHQDLATEAIGATTTTNSNGNGNLSAVPSSSLLQPGGYDPGYQPLTPPSYLDRSPSIPASTASSAHSPYNMPMSPASMADSTESWNNPGLASPSYSTNSDLYSSPGLPDLDMDLTNNQSFGRPNIDVSGTYYGAFPPASTGYEDMVSPLSAKRSRESYDEVLSDTLGSFAMEVKKKRVDPSYNEDMMGRLNALSAILEVNPITPDRLLSCLPDVNDWSQFNQLNQFCSTLFEDVSGKVFEPQAFDTLFPDYDQKQNPIALDAGFGIDGLANYNAASASLSNNSAVNNNMGFNGASQGESIYSTVIPDDPYLPTASMAPSMTYGSTGMGWDGMGVGIPTQGVVRSMPTRVGIQQPVNPFDNRNISSMINARNSRAKPDVKIELKEEIIEPRVEIKAERSYADMSTQTKAKERQAADGGMMTLQRPAEKKKQQRSPYEGMDPTLLMLSAPAVPDTPLPELERNVEDLEQAAAEDSTRGSQESEAAAASTTPSTPTSKYGGYVEKARAKQAAVAAAAAATAPVEPLDPLEAMTRQLAQTHLDESNVKIVTKPATVKPVTEGDMERQIKAAKARAMCSQDPVRKQHAEVILSLLKSIDTLMAEHRQKVALYKETQARQEAGSIRGSSPSIYPRTGVNAQKQGQIRTVSSYLPRRPPYQSSPLHQEQSGSDPAYSQLRSNLNDSPSAYASANATSSSSDTPVFYPSPNLQQTPDEEPFELSEEERRFIEEDNARIAAARQEADRQVHV